MPRRLGQGHRTNAPYQAFRTADGWINLGGGSQQFWRDICTVLEVKQLADDPRFATPALRVRHRKELEALLQPRFLTAPTSVWLEKFEAVGVPAGPILGYDQVFGQHTDEILGELGYSATRRRRSRTSAPGRSSRRAPTSGRRRPP